MTVIKIEHISKMYRLGMVGRTTLKDDLSKLYRSVFKGGKSSEEEEVAINNRASGSSADFIWSLKDINLEVQEGEVLGIIGKNGAGKSTLLKILSRVTKPTSGSIRIKGRIASLLEVGTGFHPELTGRENIFLNGAILGMTKDEIRRKFDEIVDFSGVGTFLDTPVKRYSSGMYVRLAFAVAAHLEPEILVVDEVLAVGDADFQKKCLGKMKSVSGEGRTVLFVSHNMDAVNALCSKVMMLEYGQKVYEGDTKDGVSFYLRSGAEDNYGEARLDTYQNNAMRSGKKDNLRISAVRTLNKNNEVSGRIFQNETLIFEMDFECLRLTAAPELGFAIKNAGGTQLSFFVSDWLQAVRNIAPGKYTYEFRITGLNLVPGEYTLDTWVRPQMNLPADDYIETALNLRVIQSEENQSVNYSFYVKHGAVIMDAKGQLK